MYRRLLRFGVAAACGLATAGMILAIAHATGLWLGRNTDNLWYLLKLTAPLALLLGIVAGAWPVSSSKRISTSSFFLVALGVAFGFAYWYLVTRVVAGVFLSLAIQALACWSASSAVSLLSALGRRTYGVLAGAFLICALGLVLPRPIFNVLGHNRNMTVAIVVPEELARASASPKDVGFNSESEAERSASRVLQSLHAAGLSGNYRIVHLSRTGNGKQSLAILVLNSRMEGRTQLAEPDSRDLIYVQQPNGWTKIPSEAAVLNRKIEVWGPGDHKDSLAYLDIPDADGISLIVRADQRSPE